MSVRLVRYVAHEGQKRNVFRMFVGKP